MRRSLLPKLLLPAGLGLLLLGIGCGSVYSNYREIENLQVVQTLGLDAKAGRITLTASTGQGIGGEPAVMISRPAGSIIAGVESVHHYSSKEALYLNHTRYVLLGEDADGRGLYELADYLTRSSSLRMDMTLFALTRGSAKELMVSGGGGSYDITGTLSSIETDVKNLGVGYGGTCRELIRATSEYGAALVCAVKPAASEGAVFSNGVESLPVPAGYVIFKDYRRCGLLDERAAWAANLLMNRRGFGSVSIPSPNGGSAVLVMKDSSCRYTPHWSKDGRLLRLDAELTLSASLGELTEPGGLSDKAVLELKRALNTYTEEKCAEVLELSKKLDADFLGLYGSIRTKAPSRAAPFRGKYAALMESTVISVTAKCTVSALSETEAS